MSTSQLGAIHRDAVLAETWAAWEEYQAGGAAMSWLPDREGTR